MIVSLSLSQACNRVGIAWNPEIHRIKELSCVNSPCLLQVLGGISVSAPPCQVWQSAYLPMCSAHHTTHSLMDPLLLSLLWQLWTQKRLSLCHHIQQVFQFPKAMSRRQTVKKESYTGQYVSTLWKIKVRGPNSLKFRFLHMYTVSIKS